MVRKLYRWFGVISLKLRPHPISSLTSGGRPARRSPIMYESKRSLRVLHIVLSIGETSAPYNEHCLPWADKRDITICTYFASGIKPPRAITFLEGNGSLKGFFRVLKSALGEKEYDIIHAHSPHVGLLFLFAKLFAYG